MNSVGTRDSRSDAAFCRGQRVTVRPWAEILATLDAEGKLEGVPFMPEMLPFCRRTFVVGRRADRVCVEGMDELRGLEHCVFLEGLRCDGSAHRGCHRGCLLLWKEAWLRPALGGSVEARAEPDGKSGLREALPEARNAGELRTAPDCAEGIARLATTRDNRFVCQSTELAQATRALPPGTLRHFLRDLRAGEATVGRVAYVVGRALLNRVWQGLVGRKFFPKPAGDRRKTPSTALGLKPGELVEIRSLAEIRDTLDAHGCNRGLMFDTEMASLCGRRFRVLGPLDAIISERTGQRVELSNTVLLDGAVCQGLCAANCPRAHYFFWREIWLKRAE